MTTTPNESAALALLQQWRACYRAKDVEGILALASGDDVVMVGTGADEVCLGLAALRAQTLRDFSQSDALDMTSAFEAAMRLHQAPIVDDVPNHTDSVPVIQISSVVVEHS